MLMEAKGLKSRRLIQLWTLTVAEKYNALVACITYTCKLNKASSRVLGSNPYRSDLFLASFNIASAAEANNNIDLCIINFAEN